MTQNAITSKAPVVCATDEQIGQIKGLLDPKLRKLPKPVAQAIIQAGSLLQSRFAALVDELAGKLANIYSVTVNYSQNIAQMVQAGDYNYANENISAENFPVQGSGEVSIEIVLVHFGKDMESEDVLRELDALGLRAARIEELLAFGSTHKDVQREFPIIALGSIWRRPGGDRSVPCLGDWGGGRWLSLRWFGDGWRGLCRFAAVRK